MFQATHFCPSFLKSEVRAVFYARVDPHKYHIVIAGDGETGLGDITYLMDHGVSPGRIVVCDRKQRPLEEARALGCLIPPPYTCNDILLTCSWALKEFEISALGSINVDLCAPISSSALFLQAILTLVGDKVPVSYTFIRAHDKGFSSTSQRMEELHRYVGAAETYLKEYQSVSMDNSIGSPMATVFYNTNVDMVQQEILRDTAINARFDLMEKMMRTLAHIISARIEVPLPEGQPFYKELDLAPFNSSATSCLRACQDAIRYLQTRDGVLPSNSRVRELVQGLAKWQSRTIKDATNQAKKGYGGQGIMEDVD